MTLDTPDPSALARAEANIRLEELSVCDRPSPSALPALLLAEDETLERAIEACADDLVAAVIRARVALDRTILNLVTHGVSTS